MVEKKGKKVEKEIIIGIKKKIDGIGVKEWLIECVSDFKIEWVNEEQHNEKGERKEILLNKAAALNWKEKRRQWEAMMLKRQVTSEWWVVSGD